MLASNDLVAHAEISGEGAVWHPLAAGEGSSLLKHAVNLLQGKTLGLRNKEEGVDEAKEAEGAPDEEDLGAEVGVTGLSSDHVWGDDGNDAVPEPVGGSGESNTTGTDGKREDFTDKNPSGCQKCQQPNCKRGKCGEVSLPGPQVEAKKKM